jgi:hypothetical protein
MWTEAKLLSDRIPSSHHQFRQRFGFQNIDGKLIAPSCAASNRHGRSFTNASFSSVSTTMMSMPVRSLKSAEICATSLRCHIRNGLVRPSFGSDHNHEKTVSVRNLPTLSRRRYAQAVQRDRVWAPYPITRSVRAGMLQPSQTAQARPLRVHGLGKTSSRPESRF